MAKDRSNSVNALLGLLSIAPMSGYDIRQLIPHSIGHFWSESYGQIYPALKQMTAGGLIERKTQRTKGRPDRHEYSLTEAGREHLAQWLKLPVTQRTVERSELLLKLFFGAQVEPAVSREHVVKASEAAEKTLGTFRATEDELRKNHANDPQLPFWLMTLSLGKHDSEAKIAWCKETLEQLDRLTEGRFTGQINLKTRRTT